MSQINCGVSNIEISTQYQLGISFSQIFTIFQKSVTEFHLKWHTRMVRLAIGNVDGYERKRLKFTCQCSALTVKLLISDANNNILRFLSAIHSHTAIALALCPRPTTVITIGRHDVF